VRIDAITPPMIEGFLTGLRSTRPGRALSAASIRSILKVLVDPHGRPWSSSVRSFWRRTLTRADVRWRVPETLRHTAASIELSRGCPILFVQAQGGWRSPHVWFQHYARWMPSSCDVALTPAPTQRPATSPQLRATRGRRTS
jgi:integrase